MSDETSWPLLQQRAAALRARVARGDLMIGTLSVAEVDAIPDALRRAAEAGAGAAWLELASWLSDPPYDEPDIEGAAAALEQALGAGVAGAGMQLVQLRWFYQRESAAPPERAQAHQLLRAAVDADPSDADALYLLGLLTCQGFGVAADPQAAFELQQRAAALGNRNAMFELYVHYSTGLGVPQDDPRAFDANAQAAEAGHRRALYNMGAFYATGWQVPKDIAAAVEWYERAADRGNTNALMTLAIMYALGEEIAPDREYASELLDRAEYLGEDVDELRDDLGLAA